MKAPIQGPSFFWGLINRNMPMREKFLFPWGLLFVLAVAGAFYWPTLSHHFVWDDFALFIYSPALRGESVTWGALSQPILPDTTYFRPLVLLTFFLQFHLDGINPGIAHGVNLLIFFANCGLVFFLCRTSFLRKGLGAPDSRALLAALVYAIHPALIESTAWIAGRFDLMATLLCLIALCLDLRRTRSACHDIALALLYFLALCSKEVAIALPLLILIQRLALDDTNFSRFSDLGQYIWQQSRLVVLFLIALTVYGELRLNAVHSIWHVNTTLANAADNIPTHLALVFKSLGFYLKLATIPFGTVNPLHPLDIYKILDIESLPEILLALVFLGVTLVGALRKSFACYMFLSALLTLAPVLHIIPLTIGLNVGCDRFLTLPLVFLVMGVFSLKFPSLNTVRPRVINLVTTLLIGTWSLLALGTLFTTIPLWRTDFSLRTWIYAEHPDFDQARSMYLAGMMSDQKFAFVAPIFKSMLAKGPLRADDQILYGDYLARTGDTEDAVLYIRGALEAFPPLHTMSDDDQKKYDVSSGVRIREAFGYYALANALFKAKNFAAADHNADIALWYQPNLPAFSILKSLTLGGTGQWEQSQKVFDTAVALLVPFEANIAAASRATFIKQLCSNPETNALCPTNKY
jgi:protein O-mannosyl-transferase